MGLLDLVGSVVDLGAAVVEVPLKLGKGALDLTGEIVEETVVPVAETAAELTSELVDGATEVISDIADGIRSIGE